MEGMSKIDKLFYLLSTTFLVAACTDTSLALLSFKGNEKDIIKVREHNDIVYSISSAQYSLTSILFISSSRTESCLWQLEYKSDSIKSLHIIMKFTSYSLMLFIPGKDELLTLSANIIKFWKFSYKPLRTHDSRNSLQKECSSELSDQRDSLVHLMENEPRQLLAQSSVRFLFVTCSDIYCITE
jgi:hypothetical protein